MDLRAAPGLPERHLVLRVGDWWRVAVEVAVELVGDLPETEAA
jgi:hypothetical protein